MDKDNGHDAEEKEGDGQNKVSDGIGNEAADDMEDEEYEGEEGLAENDRKEGEHEAEGQPEAEREDEREGEEKIGEEKTGEETEPHIESRGKDCAVHDGEEEEHGGDWAAGIKQGDQGQSQGVGGDIAQRVTANSLDEPWRSWEIGDTRGEADERRSTNAAEEESTIEDVNGRAEQKRKRASARSISEEHPNKRSKSDRGQNEVDTTTEDSVNRTSGPEAQPRLQTPSLTSTTFSPGSIIEIVRQHSVVPGLEGTESAVWDAARRDPIFRSLSPKDQFFFLHSSVSWQRQRYQRASALCLQRAQGCRAKKQELGI